MCIIFSELLRFPPSERSEHVYPSLVFVTRTGSFPQDERIQTGVGANWTQYTFPVHVYMPRSKAPSPGRYVLHVEDT